MVGSGYTVTHLSLSPLVVAVYTPENQRQTVGLHHSFGRSFRILDMCKPLLRCACHQLPALLYRFCHMYHTCKMSQACHIRFPLFLLSCILHFTHLFLPPPATAAIGDGLIRGRSRCPYYTREFSSICRL